MNETYPLQRKVKRPAKVVIDPEALQHNLKRAKQSAPKSHVMAVIKANAYGHGAVSVAGILYPYTDAFAVACIAEAVELREAGIDLPIMVLQGAQTDEELRVAAHYRLRLVINDLSQLAVLDGLSMTKHGGFEITLKIDTGMHRLGILPQQAHTVFQRLRRHQHVNPASLWLMTHFACADELDNTATSNQLERFSNSINKLSDDFPETASLPQSIANSAGILGWPASHSDWIRPGIMLYGSSPFADPSETAQKHHLKPAMTFSAPLIAVRSLKKGDTIGYGATWQCPEDTTVGVVACGYADGYPRHAANGTPVFLNGKSATLAGRVSMDLIVIDIGNMDAKVGDSVELWGNQVSIDSVARQAETISYELLCNAGNLNR